MGTTGYSLKEIGNRFQDGIYSVDEVDGLNDTQDSDRDTANGIQDTAIADRYTKAEVVMSSGNLNKPLLDLPLHSSLDMEAGSGNVNFSRDTTATYIDRYGVLRYASIDEARFEKDGLLIEGGSTNLLLNGSIDANWSNSRCSIDYLNTIGADGISNSASTVTVTDATGAVYAYKSGINITPTIGGVYTYSVFVNPKDFIGLVEVQLHGNIVGGSSTDCEIIYNTETKVIQSIGSLVIAYSMERVAYGFIRFSVTAVSITDVPSTFFGLVYMTNSVNGDNISIYGAQIEALPFATSYIPTTDTAVSRGSDNCTITEVYNNVPPQDSISVAIDYTFNKYVNYNKAYSIQKAGASWIDFRPQETSEVYNVSSYGDAYSSFGIPDTDIKRAVMTADGSNVKFYNNGTLRYTEVVTAEFTTPDTFGLGGSPIGAHWLFGHIKNFKIYDFALTATEAALA